MRLATRIIELLLPTILTALGSLKHVAFAFASKFTAYSKYNLSYFFNYVYICIIKNVA